MKIVDKIIEISTFIENNAEGSGLVKANDLQRKAALAMRKGMDSLEWEDYMKEFATNAAQLKRLKGKDEMMDEVWGLSALAYVVAGGVCTMVSKANTIRDMDDDMKVGLDRNLPFVPDKQNA